MEEIRV